MFPLDEYIYDCELKDSRTFTGVLKTFQQMCGEYPRLDPEHAKYIFDECVKIFRTNKKPVAQANAIRLVKFIATSTRYMQKHYVDIWRLYRETIFHKDKRVGKAGKELAERYYCGMIINIDSDPALKINTTKEKQEEMKKFLMFNYIHLMYLEKKYMKEHGIWPTEEEVYENPDMFLASNTTDLFLKNVRGGVESFGDGRRMRKIMDENGYAPNPW